MVRVAGVRYFLAKWFDRKPSGSWNYVQFNRVMPAAGVTDLKLGPFIWFAERQGWILPSSWMDSIEAGFELRSGGRGLAVTRFSASVGVTAAVLAARAAGGLVRPRGTS